MVFDTPDAEALAMDDAFWSLYDEAFPAEEREPREVISRSVASGTGVAVRARLNDTTVGLATTHLLPSARAVFLVYIATDRVLRGQGTGAVLFEQTWSASVARAQQMGWVPGTYVWEVDDPAKAKTPEEEHRRERRIGFFRRLGGQVLPGPYLQPPVDGVQPVPMLLMTRVVPGAESPTPAHLIRTIYYEKYGAANGIRDETLRDLLAATQARIEGE